MARLCALLLVLGTAGYSATAPGASAQAVGPPDAGAVAVAAAALPATPILLADGNNASFPSVGVETDGTGHITWTESDAANASTMHYCRLPRGATACERSETFAAPGGLTIFGPADVVLPGDGRVQIVVYVCCGTGIGTYLVESLNGGDSFLPARQIGTASTGYSIAGPGDNAITLMEDATSAVTGAAVQVAETDAAITSDKARFDEFYAGGVGLIDSATPIAAYTDLTNTFVRQFNAQAGTVYNDAANWKPAQSILDENEPTLVSGAAGTFLMTHIEYNNSALDDAYQVRRISADDGTLGNPFVASDIGKSIFGTMTADQDGGLTAVWTDAGETAAIRSSYAVNGTSFTRPGTVVPNARGYHLKVDTAGDGGGFVAWDENSDPRVLVAPIPAGGVTPDTDPPVDPPTNVGGFTPGNNTPKCMRKVTIKPGVVAAARSGCFDEDGEKKWVTKSDVNVNGIDFVTGGATTTVRLNTATHTITAGAGVVQKAGPIILAKDAGTWDVDGVTTFGGLEKSKIKLFDFPVLGEASVKFFNDKAEVTVNLALPKPFDQVTGQSVLTTTQAKGLILTGITLRASNLTIGEFGVRSLVVKYDAGLSVFSGAAELKLPPNGSYLGIRIGFKSGKLVVLAVTYTDGEPFPYLIYPGLWLTGLGFGYDGTDGFAIGGGGNFGIPIPTGVITIDAIGDPPGTGGGFRFAIPDSKPYAEMSLSGDLAIFGYAIGRSTAYFNTSGFFDFHSNVDIGYARLGIHGAVAGQVDLSAGTFYSEAQVEACIGLCVSAKGVISNIGIAACAGIDFGFVTIGLLVGYVWKDGFTGGTTCDTGAFITPSSGGPSNTQVTVSSDGSVFVPGSPDVTTYTIDIPGTTGVPNVVVRDGNGGLVVQSDPGSPNEPQQGDKVLLVPSSDTTSARLVIVQDSIIPKSYKITASAGSSPLARRNTPVVAGQKETTPAFTVAQSYPATAVTASISGQNRARVLTYQASNLDDAQRSVRFVETGPGAVNRVLGTTTSASGTMSFAPAPGPAGRRSIQAVVLNSDGLPVSTTSVATYDAPGWVLPGKPKNLTLSVSSKGVLTATWKGSLAKSFKVRVSVADGRRLLLLPTKGKVVVSRVSKKEKVVVTVTGVDGRGRTGPTATARR